MRVILNDVVNRITGNVDRFNTDLLYYVGGEHYDCGSIAIYNKGVLKSEKGSILGFKFHFPFQKGDTLFMARNPHLKKAGMVTYDGITSDASYVLRTKDETILLPEYLPLVIQNDEFWAFFEANKSGSVNYLMNWKEMKNYEFDLPSIDIQKRICAVVWVAEECRKNNIELVEQIDELVKSQFIEMFGSVVLFDKEWPIMTIGEIATSQLGKMLNAKNQTGKHEHLYLANRNVQWFSFDFSDLRKMDFDEKDCRKYELRDNDLLVCEGGEIGRCAVWHGEIEDCYIQNAVHRVRCNTEIIQPLFLGYCLYYHAMENGFSDIIGSKATIAHYPADKLKATKVIVPPIELQNKFIRFVEQSDKSKVELKQSVASSEALIKSIITNGLEG